MKYLDELGSLHLPLGQFAIFGSGPLAIREIRESQDIDLIVKKDLWKKLIKTYPPSTQTKPACLKIGKNIEIYQERLFVSESIDELIDSAELISGFPFVQLRYVLEWKKKCGREKDKKDVELIEAYRSEQTNSV